MGYFDSRDDPKSRPAEPAVIDNPARCVACRSTSIATTAKNPNEHSYWRCQNCGEVRNSARRNSNSRRNVPGSWR